MLLLVLLLFASACRTERGAQYSGTVETREIQVGSKVGGRVTEVLIEEGQQVRANAPLIRFEAEELKARREQLEARIAQAEAELARLERGFRPEEIQQAEAAARQQRALYEAAKKGPREQELQQAHAEYAAAKAEATNADLEFQRVSALHASGDLSAQRRDDAQARRDFTASRAEAARQRLALLQAGTREEDLRAAEQRYREAEAQADLTRSGARTEDIAAARARLREARGALAELETRLEESELRAPADSRVEVVSVRPGDLVVPNRTVVTLLEPAQLWVRVYVPETQLGSVRVGQKAAVKIDTFPDRAFNGTVEQISSQAEFLPRNVQTRDDREHQVFGVKVRIANPEGVLKSGMAATVTLE
jgi:multidrug resistance efflux pump